MAISTLDGLIGAARQSLQFIKTGTRTTISAAWFSVFEVAGNPGGGTLAGTSTSAGVVPTDATAGCPTINNFAGGALGYITQVDFASTLACRLMLADMVWKGGAYAFNASTGAMSAQPSYSGRMPGSSYVGTQIWIECVTAFTGNLSVAVTYTDQAGNAGHTTGTFATGTALTLGRMMQLPLASGDCGVQKIESVTATVASAGTFNVLVLRPLWTGRVPIVNFCDAHDWARVGMPQVFQDSALIMLVNMDSTALGIPELQVDISSG